MVGIKPPSPQQIWRFSSAHFYREVISQINNLWYNILEVIIKGWVVDHRERAESIVSWSGLHLKYNAIFFYARAGESASCQFFAASSERSATFFTPRVQWKLWKVHLKYPIDTCWDGLFAVKKIKSSAEKWRISGLFVRLVSSEKPCEKLGFLVWKHIYFSVSLEKNWMAGE